MKLFVAKFAKLEEGRWRETYRRETFSINGDWVVALDRILYLALPGERVIPISEGGYH